MLEIRPVCENCGKNLPNENEDAMVCSYECTFCAECVETVLENVCPNCGGGFERRPIRPKAKLLKDPAKTQPHFKPVVMDTFKPLLERNRNLRPNER